MLRVPNTGFQFYDTWSSAILSNITFRNYKSIPGYTGDPEANQVVLLGMTHSDQYKPQVRLHRVVCVVCRVMCVMCVSLDDCTQQIAATTNLRFENCDDSMRVHIKNRDTGSSRYYSILDFDGSVVGKNDVKAYILGSATTNWYKWSSACFLKKEWNVWACPKGTREISTLNFAVPRNNFIGSVHTYPCPPIAAATPQTRRNSRN